MRIGQNVFDPISPADMYARKDSEARRHCEMKSPPDSDLTDANVVSTLECAGEGIVA